MEGLEDKRTGLNELPFILEFFRLFKDCEEKLFYGKAKTAVAKPWFLLLTLIWGIGYPEAGIVDIPFFQKRRFQGTKGAFFALKRTKNNKN